MVTPPLIKKPLAESCGWRHPELQARLNKSNAYCWTVQFERGKQCVSEHEKEAQASAVS